MFCIELTQTLINMMKLMINTKFLEEFQLSQSSLRRLSHFYRNSSSKTSKTFDENSPGILTQIFSIYSSSSIILRVLSRIAAEIPLMIISRIPTRNVPGTDHRFI